MPKRKKSIAEVEPAEKKTINKSANNNKFNCVASSDNYKLHEFVKLSQNNSLKQDDKLALEKLKNFEGKQVVFKLAFRTL